MSSRAGDRGGGQPDRSAHGEDYVLRVTPPSSRRTGREGARPPAVCLKMDKMAICASLEERHGRTDGEPHIP
jgi:hypothetical protein